MSKLRFLIVSGGTGGHIYPGLALAEEISSRGHDLTFVTEEAALGKELITKAGWKPFTIGARPLKRNLSLETLLAPFFAIYAVWQALVIIQKVEPSVVITTGGYSTLPMVLASWLFRKPIVLQEQNSSLGLSNRIGQFFAKKICLSFEKTALLAQKNKAVVTGNPIRRQFTMSTKAEALDKYRLADNEKSILVVGGSLGARKLNETIIDLLDWFKESRIQVLHVVGNRDYHSFRTCIDQSKYPLYRMLAYEDEMGKALRFADLVISRAGATAISEILALGKPSILIPYPFAADDHQTYNARILEDAGAAVAIPDRELTPSLLRTKISALYSNETILSKMSLSARGLAQLDAAIKIVNLAESLK